MFVVEVRLHAVTEEVPKNELRDFYKANECPVVSEILDRAPSIRLGTTEVTSPENDGARGPVGRVDGLLYLRGTSEWPPTDLPLLNAQLERDLTDAFEMQLSDPAFEVLPVSEFIDFLAAHRGSRLATTSSSIG